MYNNVKNKVSIFDVAEFAILYGNERGFLVTQKRLHKFLYLIQAWNLAIHDFNLYLNDELPEAWINGPTYKTIYEKYKQDKMFRPLFIEDEDADWEDLYEKIHLELKDESCVELIIEVLDKF
jgi:uncharacterized phage-associated protein